MKPGSPEWYRDWEANLDGQPTEVPSCELRHLLRCARALAEVQEHYTTIEADMLSAGGWQARVVDGCEPQDFVCGPALLTTIEAALRRAEEARS